VIRGQNGQESLDAFTCFPASERKVIRYTNDVTGLREVTGLPQVRIMMCGYSSQCALNMVAYLFMKEKLGMDVTFYPTADYSQVWNGEFWDDYNDSICDNAYPRKYFSWLEEDVMDLNFEFWPLQYVAYNDDGSVKFDFKSDYVLNGKVDFGGFVGAYGEISVYIPKYWVEANPTHIVPQIIKDDESFRSALINGSTQGSTDWVAKYLAERESHPFDEPTSSKPMVWGSVDGYVMSEYAHGVLNNVIAGGMDVSFATTGSESSLMELVKTLYSERAAFLANIYTIDDNFGVLDSNGDTIDLQNFEKLVFPRNPDQSTYDPCYMAKKCQNPVEPIMKAANPLLKSRFPEAYQFFTGFSMGTRQINKMVSYYLQVYNNESMDSTTKWLHAACQWMKDEESKSTWNTSSWNIEIERTDCLNGCGINGVGGSCNYYEGQCECHYDELFADTDCKQSCPGLVGPYHNDSGSMVFGFCSEHGVCDVMTRQCSCEDGYGDEGCGTKYEQYQYVALMVVVCAISSILAMLGIGCIVWLRMSAEYKTVKALSINMTTLMTMGLISLVSSNIAVAVPVSSASCIAWQWLFGLGGVLAIMSPLLKAYRVSRVFHGGKMLRAVKITDNMLMATLIKAAVIECLICIGYSVSHQYFGGTQIYYNHIELRTEVQCNSAAFTSYLSLGSYAYFFCILCALTYYSWGTRRALAVFKESTCAYFSSFLSLLCSLITFVFYLATDDPAFRIAVQSFAIIIVIVAVFVLFYATRIYAFFARPEDRNVTDARGASHAASSSSSAISRADSSVMQPGPSANA